MVVHRAYLFYYGNASSSGASILALGSLQHNFLKEVEFYIVDSIGDFYVFKKNWRYVCNLYLKLLILHN